MDVDVLQHTTVCAPVLAHAWPSGRASFQPPLSLEPTPLSTKPSCLVVRRNHADLLEALCFSLPCLPKASEGPGWLNT